MTIKPFFPVFIVLVGVVVYAYYAPEQRPESGVTVTPKEYIELIEKPKTGSTERREESNQEQSDPPSAESAR